jgi:CheY-like chemotaxis protein
MKQPWRLEDPPILKEGGELADLWWPYAADRKILVIEEHLPYLSYLQMLLGRAGYEVISATRAAEGVQRATEERPDVVVMDRRLPALRRFRLLDQLGEEPATARIPTILVYLGKKDSSWRPGDEYVGYISGDPAALVEVLRRLDIAALHRTEAAGDPQPNSSRQRPVGAPSQAQPTRILAADDERHVVRFMEAHLRQADYKVITCFDARELLEKARTEPPDAIIMDMLMPFTDSWLKVYSTLKADPVTASIPLVLLSSHHPGVFPALWTPPSGSVARFLVKPFSPPELLAAVAAALERNLTRP